MAEDGRNRDDAPSAPSGGNPSGTKNSTARDQTELDSLSRQVGDLSEQVQRYVSGSVGAALRRAGDGTSEMMSYVGARGRKAVEDVQEVKDNLAGAIDASLKNRSYTTLAIAFGVGFFFARLR
jgi:hypothetical protein